jgi:hypothetical protein
MRNKVALVTALLSLTASAQEKLNSLTTPSSPAAAVIGMQPSAILKPKSFRALETALYTNFTDNSGNTIIPNDFALEFMPYWANPHGLSLEEYLYPKVNFDQIIRNSALSVASTQNFKLQDSTATKSVAFGYRTSLFFGNQQDKEILTKHVKDLTENQRIGSYLIAQLESLKDQSSFTQKEEYLNGIKEKLTNRIYTVLKLKNTEAAQEYVEKIYAETDSLPFDANQTDTFFTAFADLTEKHVGGSYDEFKTYLKNRQGLLLDFACALHLNFPGNNFNFSEVPKYAVWLTPTYNFSKNLDFLKVSGALRYEKYYLNYFEKYFPDSDVFKNNLDYGFAAIGNFKKFGIGVEAMGRTRNSLVEVGQDGGGNPLYQKKSNSDFQCIGTFTYQLTEQIVLSYQFGKAFKPVFTVNNGTTLSLLTLNFGFGGPDRNDVKLP